MRRLVCTVLVIALASAGCIGSSSSSTSTGRSDDLGLIPLKTDLTITYTVPTCPPEAHCVAGIQSDFLVRRYLTCSPDRGDYDDPAAVCRALTDVVAKLGKKNWSCGCLTQKAGLADPQAMGFYRGKGQTIPLDGCSLCNLRGIGGDLKLLLPGAG
jgi:hypothetical protein